MNNNYITQLNKKKLFSRKNSYNPKYTHRKNQFYRKAPRWLLSKQRLINKRGLYLKHVYANFHRVIIFKYMHLILVWWYILSYRYLQLLQRVHLALVWCEYYVELSAACSRPHNQHYSLQLNGDYLQVAQVPLLNPYKWAITSFKAKKRGLYQRRRNKRGGFFRIRRSPQTQGYGKYLPPRQYALVKAFYSPSGNQMWEEKFTLPINIVKVRRVITHPRVGLERKRYLFINFTAFTVRGRNKSYLYYTNIK